MLTTTLDGLWTLQVLSGLEVLAPELGLRPHLPSVESTPMALAQPVARDLRDAGVIDADGRVEPTVLEWLTVLSRRDVALLLSAQTPTAGGEPERVLLARFAQWWVALERHGLQVRLSGAGIATSEQAAADLINAQVERLCGHMTAPAMKPATLEIPDLIAVVGETGDLGAYLADRGFDTDQICLLTLAADSDRSARATLVAIQSGVPTGPGRRHIGPGAVSIIDTPRGRLLSEHLTREGRSWMIVSPGSPGNLASAVLTMMRELPAHEDWFSYRKVV